MATAISFQLVDRLPQPEKLALGLVFFLLATFPLIFGAVHPIVQGGYTLLILVGLGGWLLYAMPELAWQDRSWFWLTVPIILVGYIALQSLPLPLSIVELLSPARAARINMVNTLAQTKLTTASLSDNGIVGIQSTIFIFSLLLYYLVLTTLLRRNRKIVLGLLYVIAGVGLFEGVYGLFQVMNPHLGILWLPITSKGAAHGTIIYKNQYASFLNMCWPLALAGGIIFLESVKDTVKAKPVKRKLQHFFQSVSLLNIQVPFFFFAAGIMILAVVFSFSRGGILAMLLLIVFLYFFMPSSRRIKMLLTVLLIIFLGGYGSLLGLDGVFSRFATIDDSGLTRLHIYISSLPMLFDHWLSGIGFGSFPLLSGVYLKEFPENLLFDRVHNDYLELAIELGLPMALLFFAWLFGGIVVAGKKLLQKSRVIHEECRISMIVGCAAFCSLLGFLIHGLVDFGWRLPANALYAVTLIALISYAIGDHGQTETI
jgi:O-antigen ligase